MKCFSWRRNRASILEKNTSLNEQEDLNLREEEEVPSNIQMK
jgi:hypothetical protein